MVYLIAYLLASGLLMYGSIKRGRATRMNSDLMPLLAWGASAVGLFATFGTPPQLQYTTGAIRQPST